MDKLNPADRALFDISTATEWENWKTFEAVEPILPQDVPEGTKIIGTRWGHTDKNMQAKQVGRKVPTKAKSRLVVQGHQEYVSFRCDSPTASLLFFNLLCSMATTYGWQVKAADAARAYLQSDGIKRLLILRPPWPLPDPSLRGYLLRAKGTIYGTKDAGRGWWLKLRRILMTVGWKEHPLEPACFMMHDGAVLIGLLMVHVERGRHD